MGILVLPIFTSKGDQINDIDEMAEKLQASKEKGTKLEENDFLTKTVSEEYNERMSGLLEDMYRLKYI